MSDNADGHHDRRDGVGGDITNDVFIELVGEALGRASTPTHPHEAAEAMAAAYRVWVGAAG